MQGLDSWLRDLFSWSFDHEILSSLFIAIPISIWVILGLFVILFWGAMNEDASWKKVFGVVFGIYLLTPIAYWLLAGYIGNLIYG